MSWGPTGPGEWVKVTQGMLEQLTFPCWGKYQEGHEVFRIVLDEKSVVCREWGDGILRPAYVKSGLVGEYVWVPALPAKQPAPEPEAKLDLPEKPLLQVAQEIINGPKADDYGPAHINLGRLAVRWSQVVGVPVSIEQVGLMMADLKICRLIHNPNHYDSWVDLAGYPGVVDKAWRGE